MKSSTDLSFVIIGKNAEWSIARLLNSIFAHTPPRISHEVIYVDSASTDRTIEIVKQYPVRILQLSDSSPLCASAGRFIGSQYAAGDSIVFIDSDMELLNGWLGQAMNAFNEEPDLGVVTGTIVDVDRTTGSGFVNARIESCGGRLTEIEYAGNAAMFRRAALDMAGTWNPYIVSDEEPELCLRIRDAGYRIARLNCPISCHFTYPTDKIATLCSRRKRNLFLGYGQVIRYHLHTGLLVPYLRERGWVMMPALAVLVAMTVVLLSCLSGNMFWVAGLSCLFLLAFAADVLRSRSLYRAIFHVCHRAFILEGAVKGFLMRPHAPEEFPRNERLIEPQWGSTCEQDVPAASHVTV